MNPSHVPVIPGWVVSAVKAPDGFTAVRVDELSAYQRTYGCRVEVSASTALELEVLCIAETVHAAMVARAEERLRTSQRIAEMLADQDQV